MPAAINCTRKQTTKMFKLISKLQYSMLWLLSFLIHMACGPDLLCYCSFSVLAIAVMDGSKVTCYKWDSEDFIHCRTRGDISLNLLTEENSWIPRSAL